jgi:hypothetical protein
LTAEQEATIEKYRRLLSERWGIRKVTVLDPDGWTAAQVIGGRE